MVPSRFGDFYGKHREKHEITRVMLCVLVPSRFCEINGKYHDAICSIMALSCFGELHGKYHETKLR